MPVNISTVLAGFADTAKATNFLADPAIIDVVKINLNNGNNPNGVALHHKAFNPAASWVSQSNIDFSYIVIGK